jgi:hypothetical protein
MTNVRTAIKKKLSSHYGWILLAFLLLALVGTKRAQASVETLLPMQEITFGGKVTVPSCTVRLDTEHLRFDRSVESAQRQNLILSECDVEGLGVMFQAQTWPDHPARGVLKNKDTKNPSDSWHYRVAPAAQQEPGTSAIWPLSAATDAPDLELDTPNPERNPLGQYFSLDRVNYWYDIKRSPQGGKSLTIPFLVSVHRTPNCNDRAEDLEAVFSLQLTYR